MNELARHFGILIKTFGLLCVLIYFADLLSPDFGPKLNLMEFDLNTQNDLRSGSSILKQIFLLTSFLLYTTLTLASPILKRFFLQSTWLTLPFFVMIFLCVLSSLWSEVPYLSLKRSFAQALILAVLIQSVAWSYFSKTLVKTTLAFCALFILASLLAIGIGHGFLDGSLVGWLNQKNNYGALCLFALMLIKLTKACSPLSIKEVQLGKAFYLIIFFLLILSGSKTCLLLAVVLSGADLFYYRQWRWIGLVGTLLLVSLFFLPLTSLDMFGEPFHVGRAMTENSLTGRGQIWTLLYTTMSDPKGFWLGAGYGTYFNTGDVPEALDIQHSYLRHLNSAHNGFIELALQFGIPLGFCITILILMQTSALGIHRIVVSTVFITMLYNITESALLRDQHPMWAITVIALTLASCQRFSKR